MANQPVLYRDRRTGCIHEEPVLADRTLRFLYGSAIGRAFVGTVLKRKWVSKAYGWWQNRPGSRRRIPRFAAHLGMDLAEAERPLSEYVSLNDFFTRRLRPECRPVDPDPKTLVSPADGRVTVVLNLDVAVPLRIKQSRVSLADLLNDGELAQSYDGGTAVVVRLAPADYHRFHFPDDGTATPSREVSGHLHSVHAIALAGDTPCFLNQRMISFLDSSVFGRIALIEVGAMLVGGIRQTYTPGVVRRGTEKGYFFFGASTVVMLLARERVRMDEDLLWDGASGMETLVQMGTRIGVR